MVKYNHMVDILLNTTFFMLPVVVATLLLLKVLLEYIFNWEMTLENQATGKSTGIRIMLASIAVFLGLLFCSFATWLLFFPSHNIPKMYKILGIILYFGFWALAGILYRLTKADAPADRSVPEILNKIFLSLRIKKIL